MVVFKKAGIMGEPALHPPRVPIAVVLETDEERRGRMRWGK